MLFDLAQTPMKIRQDNVCHRLTPHRPTETTTVATYSHTENAICVVTFAYLLHTAGSVGSRRCGIETAQGNREDSVADGPWDRKGFRLVLG